MACRTPGIPDHPATFDILTTPTPTPTPTPLQQRAFDMIEKIAA
jgi:hypothetical protein